jgi:hypothetical protein
MRHYTYPTRFLNVVELPDGSFSQGEYGVIFCSLITDFYHCLNLVELNLSNK